MGHPAPRGTAQSLREEKAFNAPLMALFSSLPFLLSPLADRLAHLQRQHYRAPDRLEPAILFALFKSL